MQLDKNIIKFWITLAKNYKREQFKYQEYW